MKERNAMQAQQPGGLVGMLLNHFGGDLAKQLSQRLGIDEATARQAIAIAIPLLIAALARNTRTSAGADSLSGALQRDHDGSILGQLGNLFNQRQLDDGKGILRHTLGKKQSDVEQRLTNATGVDGATLLQMLAPLVMGQLGKVQRQENLDAGGVAGMLRKEQQQVRRSDGGLMSILSQILGSALRASSAQRTSNTDAVATEAPVRKRKPRFDGSEV